MPTELAYFISTNRMIDTHEHQPGEEQWVRDGAKDILNDLFGNYQRDDLIAAGATPDELTRAFDHTNPDIAGRFALLARAWHAMRHTGYAEKVRLHARRLYGVQEITPETLAAVNHVVAEYRQPGQRLRLLRDEARLDHIQSDFFSYRVVPDPSGVDFFLYDLSWAGFSNGQINFEEVARDTGIAVGNLKQLRDAMAAIFSRFGPAAIAVKTQHAYNRTLQWQPRSDADAARALETVLRWPRTADESARLCLGDWCLARGVELAIEHNLPVKIHTGYYAGNDRMPLDWVQPANLCVLLKAYPRARFVLMHMGYPYGEELVALAKHYANVYVDLCWAWSINPFASMNFVRSYLHAAPINKLFAFGGDCFSPTHCVAYSLQTRKWLTRALQAEVEAREMSEQEAIAIVTQITRTNQQACFDIEGRRAYLREALAK
jgi:hypothetical protein